MKIVDILSDKITVPSEYLKDVYVKYGLRKEKTTVVYNFMEFPKINKKRIDEIKRKLGIRNEKIILFVGSMIEEKGIKVLLDAFEKISGKIKDSKLIFVGKSFFSDKIEKMNFDKKLINRIIFTGWIDEIDKPNYYYISDVVVIPSLIPETFSLVFLEASLSKKLIIASNIGALSNEIDEGVNGFLVEPNNSSILTDKIHYAFKNYKKLEKIRENAYLIATERYSANKIAGEFIRLYGW